MACAGGIVAWLALGPKLGFGDDWQLYVNTATATELMIMTTFLQNTKRRHRAYMQRCSRQLAAFDSELQERITAAAGEVATLLHPVSPLLLPCWFPMHEGTEQQNKLKARQKRGLLCCCLCCWQCLCCEVRRECAYLHA